MIVLNPKKGINDIHLNIKLNKLFQILSNESIRFLYDKSKPLTAPYSIKLIQNDIDLIINPDTQKLSLIQLNNLNQSIKYNDKIIYNFDFNTIYNEIFGPTYKGDYQTDHYILSYPGISFIFDIKGLPTRSSSTDNNIINRLLKFNPKVIKIHIHKFNSYQEFISKRNDTSFTNDDDEDVSIKKLIYYKETITLQFNKHPTSLESLSIVLNESNQQDLLMSLGPPDDVYVKNSSKTKIHSITSQTTRQNETDHINNQLIIHNYYKLGLDLIYNNQKIQKLIIHNNLPLNHLKFGKYSKCSFELPITVELTNKIIGFQRTLVSNNQCIKDMKDPIIINRSTSNDELEIINDHDDDDQTKIYTLQSINYLDEKNRIIYDLIDGWIDHVTIY